MANEERGEVELVAGTSTYTLCLSMNAICEMQARTGKKYSQLLQELVESSDAVVARDFLWMTLKKYHGGQFPDIESVGNMVDDVEGGIAGAMVVLERMLILNAEKKKAIQARTTPTAELVTT